LDCPKWLAPSPPPSLPSTPIFADFFHVAPIRHPLTPSSITPDNQATVSKRTSKLQYATGLVLKTKTVTHHNLQNAATLSRIKRRIMCAN
jgi:hypothetical protein